MFLISRWLFLRSKTYNLDALKPWQTTRGTRPIWAHPLLCLSKTMHFQSKIAQASYLEHGPQYSTAHFCITQCSLWPQNNLHTQYTFAKPYFIINSHIHSKHMLCHSIYVFVCISDLVGTECKFINNTELKQQYWFMPTPQIHIHFLCCNEELRDSERGREVRGILTSHYRVMVPVVDRKFYCNSDYFAATLHRYTSLQTHTSWLEHCNSGNLCCENLFGIICWRKKCSRVEQIFD